MPERKEAGLSIEEQIYGLSQIWSEAKYNFVFWNVRDIDWDKEFFDTLKRVSKPMNLLDYYLELSRFISLLNDGHTYVDFPKEISKNFLALPIKIKYMSGQHIIINVQRGLDIPLFSKIEEINDIAVDEYLQKRILPYCWNIKPTSSFEQLYVFRYIGGNADKNAYSLIPIIENNKVIKIKTDSGTYMITPTERNIEWSLPTELKCSEELNNLFESNGLRVALTDDEIAIITLPHFEDDNMPKNFYRLLDTLKQCNGFIIDIRNNGGGHSNNADMFSQAFIKGKFKSGKVKHMVHIGAYKAWGAGENLDEYDLSNDFNRKIYDVCKHNLCEEEVNEFYCPECPLTLEQPVIILENAATGSSSENLLINFDTINRAKIMGVASYGTTGNPLFVNLPGGGLARICTRRYTYPDDREFINIGIQPQIHADLTKEDMISGIDGVLNKALFEMRSMI